LEDFLEEHLFDDPELEERGPRGIDPELPAQNYFNRVQGIPLLTRAEQNELIERWQKFRDEKARDRVIHSHLRMPPAIARKAVRGREPNKHIISSDAIWDAWKGYRELVEELTAEGNLALVESVDHFDPTKGYAFATYAGRCIKNAVQRHLRELTSAVHRPWGKPCPLDIILDPKLPDMMSPHEYCGGQARVATPSDDDERKEGQQLPGKYKRLRRKPDDHLLDLDLMVSDLPKLERKVMLFRQAGLKLREVAEELGVSPSTAWRIEQSARKLWNSLLSNCQATPVGG
jgi:RNA polymerase sigma factor (sigma-70 family)